MHCPTSDHWDALKQLLRYLNGTLDKGINIFQDSPSTLHAFSNADWAGDRDDYISTMGLWSSLVEILLLGAQRSICLLPNPLPRPNIVLFLLRAYSELIWVYNLLIEMGVRLSNISVIFCDKLCATCLSANPIFHSKMKHIAIVFYFIREQIQNGKLWVTHVPISMIKLWFSH